MMEGAPLPQRSSTVATNKTTATTTTTGSGSDDDAIPESDHSSATTILHERLMAWKHVCGYLESYITATHKLQRTQSKELEKILKTVSEPLRENHHFIQGNGGIVSLFDTLRNDTRGISNLHLETEKNLKSNILPILERLHGEIKAKAKELKTGATKSSKAVSKARENTQKHIELLGQYSAAYDSNTKTKIDSPHDPYLLCRGVYHRLDKQIAEENNNLQEILSIQSTFQQFESHVLETIQDALNQFSQCMGSQSDRQRALYAEVAATAQQVPTDFEWANFYERNDASLLNPTTPQRTMSNIQFPNQEHRSTTPLVSGMLDRKSRAMVKGYSQGFYVISPAGYLHGFKDSTDSFKQDPTPDISLYLPECTVGAFDGLKFSIKGKDVSGGKVGNAFHMTTDLHFKAPTQNDADTWSSALSSAAFAKAGSGSQPTSPSVSRSASGMQPLSPQVEEKTETSPTPTSPAPSSDPQKDAASDPQEEGVVPKAAPVEKYS